MGIFSRHNLDELKWRIAFRIRYGFSPPPSYYDLSGYETILTFLITHETYKIPGDIVEIGAFLGGGTYKLCKFYEGRAPDKKIFVVDIFDPDCDCTECLGGVKMREIYAERLSFLQGKSQLEIFRSVTGACKNMSLLIGDSKHVGLPCKKISFAFIDGNHSSEYVINDFYKVWELLSPHGVIAFDDYGYDLPQVTETINTLIGREYHNIKRVDTAGLKIIFITKKEGDQKKRL
jgi:hypothetical protein